MNLTIDIGNTRIKLGMFEKERLLEKWIWEDWSVEELFSLATNQKVKNVILCNVGKTVPEKITKVLINNFFYIELNSHTPLPIQNTYRTPETLGKDRLAAVVGAYSMFPNQNCLVIDAGTCITYEFLSADGVYLGGNIAPGLEMRLKAMHHFTAKLPLVEMGEIENVIGFDTKSAMRNGAQLGAALEIQGFIDWCGSEWGSINVILTGGDADFLVKNLKSQIFVNPNLVLQGLNKILNYNVEL
ncbi:MAG: type III pantothenate kinase [Saprospiraceae bacterium]|nr:type III pantothenate kinase [Saprospiraceae bacterium]